MTERTIPHSPAVNHHDVTASEVRTRRLCDRHGRVHPILIEACSCGARTATHCGLPVPMPREVPA